MIKNKIKGLLLIISSIILHGGVFAAVQYNITVPKINNNEIGGATSDTISGSEDFMYNFMAYINQNIWYIITVLLFGLMLRAGFELLVGEGQQDIVKKINYFVLYSLIGLLVASMSYVLIDVIINLF